MKLIFLVASFVSIAAAGQNLDLLYEWKYVDFVWNSKEQKNNAIRTGDYNFTNVQMIGVDYAKDGRVFVTNLRFAGVPASLSTISNLRGEGGPLLKPYPDWSWHRKGNCNGIMSVFRVRIDACNRLYVLDTGSIFGFAGRCPAKLLIFDLYTDKLIKKIEIPDNVAQNKTGQGALINLVVQTYGPYCILDSVYIGDTLGRGLIVVNSQRQQQFRLESKIFTPEELYTNVSIAGKSFFVEDSVFGMALTTPDLKYGEIEPELYLRPLASRSLYAAKLSQLENNNHAGVSRFRGNPSMLPSQATAMDFSADGTLFFGLTREIALGCWNRHREMIPSNIDIVAQDYQRLQFISDVKILPKSRSFNGCEEILIMSNGFQDFVTRTRNFNKVNFRIFKGAVEPLVRGTKCTPPISQYQENYNNHKYSGNKHVNVNIYG